MSKDDERDITYNHSLEQLVAEEAEKCAGYSWLHEHAERYYNIRNTAVTLPTIVLSTLVGFLSGSSSSIFTEATMASIGIGSVSLFTGVLSTVGTFFSFSKKAEGHRIASIQYSKLGRFLAIELTLPRNERIRASDLLKITKEHIERLMETSPPVPASIISQFNSKFKDTRGVAKPAIVNGLHKVEINSKAITIQTPPAEDGVAWQLAEKKTSP